ncbi:broad-complex core protein isoforms 1/2/3/4/5-like isoform X2 [Onthophagus taurus]|uniref:broad-complex core protein isoforms 1/2/3/4/5-like isoform X2 n=1 Tax=Onthophagus taurus TaxID=166361 RepID=UPI000C20F58F|nr:broad-complex core protein isoforms 1/2/3/4/5-like isoform X2 [Onthophagus taurus]
MSIADEQQFCLRWNNFQANITSQFEALRDDEDFTDVTIACDGQRLQAHKVVLSACSPFFKELFKTNPCPHPIIFMRDVEARHIVALMEFMYAGEVNVAQAQLSAFLKTAESLKIRGLTDTSSSEPYKERDDDTVYLNPKPSSSKHGPSFPLKHSRIAHKSHISSSSSSTVTSSQDVPANNNNNINKIGSPPPSKRQCKNERIESDLQRLKELSTFNEEAISVNPFSLQEDVERNGVVGDGIETKSPGVIPKVELPDYISDEEKDENSDFYQHSPNAADLTGGMEIIPQANAHSSKDNSVDVNTGTDSRKLHSLDPRPCEECGRVYSNLSNLRQHMKLIHYPTYVQCPICQKDFKTDLYLRRHMLGSHEIGGKLPNGGDKFKQKKAIIHAKTVTSQLGYQSSTIPKT